jgi:hypothetical protein
LVLTFHGDESYDGRGFMFGGYLGPQCEWGRLESQWLRRLEHERKNGRALSRFHAKDCAALQGEYEGWSESDRDAHVRKLVSIIRRRSLGIVAAGVDLDALKEVFPGDKRDPIAGAYDLAFRETMILIARAIRKTLDIHVTIVHECCRFNGLIQKAFWKLKDDARWPHGHRFETCTPMSWKDCISLQPADMVAFDSRRALYARLVHSSTSLRRSLRELASDGRPVFAKYFDKPTLLALRKLHQSYRHEEGLNTEGN